MLIFVKSYLGYFIVLEENLLNYDLEKSRRVCITCSGRGLQTRIAGNGRSLAGLQTMMAGNGRSLADLKLHFNTL